MTKLTDKNLPDDFVAEVHTDESNLSTHVGSSGVHGVAKVAGAPASTTTGHLAGWSSDGKTLTDAGATSQFEPEGITSTKWLDQSTNALDGVVSGAVSTNTIKAFSVLSISANGGGTSGSGDTEHPYLACKKLIATASSRAISKAHGLDLTKIAYIYGKLTIGTTSYSAVGGGAIALRELTWDATNVSASYTSNFADSGVYELYVYYKP